MRILAMCLVLISVLLVVPETKLSPSGPVSTAFLPAWVSSSPADQFAAPLEPKNTVRILEFAQPTRHTTPALAVVARAEPMPAFDATLPGARDIVVPIPIPSDAVAIFEDITDTPEITATEVPSPETDIAEPVVAQAPAADLPDAPQKDMHRVAVDRLNMRGGPSGQFGVVTIVTAGETAEVMAREGNWAHIRMEDSGTEGWVYARYLAATGDT